MTKFTKGTLVLEILSAELTREVENFSKMDPFAEFVAKMKNNEVFKHRTEVANEMGKKPIWKNNTVTLEIDSSPDAAPNTLNFNQTVTFRVWEKDLTKEDAVGHLLVTVGQLCFNGGNTRDYEIRWLNGSAGTIKVKSKYTDPSFESEI